ncbi:hypothetical protein [Serratia sp. DD3]|uniref:hypothetical protein n=1 Tax=Serratia sp. DD3 TaxID=1410619 RepID=UPI0003C4E0C5|nr:hypothetical protein [Serratia sp. DD3]KEY58856.1 hypothetical protein SRDD_22460 [Serratia sp. DD3]
MVEEWSRNTNMGISSIEGADVPWVMKKLADNIIVLLGGLIGGAAVWLTLFFIVYFDSWAKRLLAISAMYLFIYLLGKFIDGFKAR